MEKDLSNYRKTYQKGELLIKHVPANPIELFRDWFNEVEIHFNQGETNAMTISTIGLDEFPKNRVVLLKKYTEKGFIFYTNYNSEKGKAIANNPNVCLSFFWHKAERQVIIKGEAKKVEEKMSDAYFKTRPRGSQLGAIASEQSDVIRNREVLEERLRDLEIDLQGKEIDRPLHWGGYIVEPTEIEFWQGRPNRLHDRIRYKLLGNQEWKIDRLSP